MKFFLNLIILFISLISFGQKKEYKHAKILYKDKLFIESNAILDKILNKEYGVLYKDDSRENINLQGLFEMDCWELKKDCLLKIRDYQAAYTSAEKYNELFRKFVGSSEGFNELASNELKKIESLIKNGENQESVSVENVKSNNSQIDGIIDNNIEKTNNPASSDKTVTLTVSGIGKTLEDAKLNALRSAIEQAFGAFISSKTEILNDTLVKDEIVSIANGNVQKYDLVSQVEIPNNGYAITLSATVSIDKLTAFAESKGVLVEFEGGMFATKILLQKLNEDSEFIAIKNLLIQTFKGLENSVDYSLIVNEPILVPESRKTKLNNDEEQFEITFQVVEKSNSNYNNVWDYFNKILDKINLTKEQAEEIQKTGKSVCQLFVDNKIYLLRNEKSINALFNFSMLGLLLSPNSFVIKNNLETVKIDSKKGNFFRAFISVTANNLKDFDVSLVTTPEQIDVMDGRITSTSKKIGSLLSIVKARGLDLDSLLNYSFIANKDNYAVYKKDNNISILTPFVTFGGLDEVGWGNLTYRINYSLTDIKKLKSFEIVKVPFEEILLNYHNYRKNILR
jgi:hypothetical protein